MRNFFVMLLLGAALILALDNMAHELKYQNYSTDKEGSEKYRKNLRVVKFLKNLGYVLKALVIIGTTYAVSYELAVIIKTAAIMLYE